MSSVIIKGCTPKKLIEELKKYPQNIELSVGHRDVSDDIEITYYEKTNRLEVTLLMEDSEDE